MIVKATTNKAQNVFAMILDYIFSFQSQNALNEMVLCKCKANISTKVYHEGVKTLMKWMGKRGLCK